MPINSNSTPLSKTLPLQNKKKMRQSATILKLFSLIAQVATASVLKDPQAPLGGVPYDTTYDEYASTSIHWDYTGGTGPLLWTKLNKKEWADCASGEIQSPININSKMKPSGFKYEWSAPLRACYNMTNNGHLLEMTPTCPPIGGREVEGAMIEDDWFNLAGIQFHTPSEHRYLDEYYPVEVHFMMKSPKTGRYAVRGVFFDISNIQESDFWSGISPYLWSVRNSGQWIKLPAVNTMNIMKVFQKAGVDNKVFNYQGSLTTPPCSQNVIWDIMSVPQFVSVETYNLLKKIMKFNARYTQNTLGKGNLLQEACQKR